MLHFGTIWGLPVPFHFRPCSFGEVYPYYMCLSIPKHIHKSQLSDSFTSSLCHTHTHTHSHTHTHHCAWTAHYLTWSRRPLLDWGLSTDGVSQELVWGGQGFDTFGSVSLNVLPPFVCFWQASLLFQQAHHNWCCHVSKSTRNSFNSAWLIMYIFNILKEHFATIWHFSSYGFIGN